MAAKSKKSSAHDKASVFHRLAAHHFEAAAHFQHQAADADDRDDSATTVREAYLAYGHQVQAVYYAEMAAVENEVADNDAQIRNAKKASKAKKSDKPSERRCLDGRKNSCPEGDVEFISS